MSRKTNPLLACASSAIIAPVPRWDYTKLPDFMESSLPSYSLRIIHQLSHLAGERGLRTYLVGGGAREVLRGFVQQISPEKLRYFLFDLDLAVEGDSLALAKAAKDRYGGDFIYNERFRTAKWTTSAGHSVDLATCRREEYPAPGSLPEVVSEAEIFEDLLRRDFSVNSLALSINADDFGSLIDPTGGVGDIFGKVLRVLHESSFFEDPTRMIRAVRYSTRLDYKMDEQTTALFQYGVEEGFLDTVSPERIRYELECILNEEVWFGVLWSALTSDLLASLHPAWNQLPTSSGKDVEVLELGIRNQSELLEKEMVSKWIIRLSWSLFSVPIEVLPALLDRIGMHKRLAKSIIGARVKYDEVCSRMNHPAFSPSRIYRVCHEYPRKTLLFIVFDSYLDKATEPLRHNLLKHLKEFSPRRNVLSGEHLINLGLPPGPLVDKAQNELWWHYLDGELPSQESVEKVARELVERYLSRPIV